MRDNPDFWIYLVLGIGLFIGIVAVVKKLIFRFFKQPDEQLGQQAANDNPRSSFEQYDNDEPKCVTCKKLVATEPSPIAERSRGTMIRDHLSMPPRYRRVVPKDAQKIFCRHHAHVADARLVEFIDKSVRAAFSEAYAKAATDIARFEQEGLLESVAESLTEAQRKDRRKLEAVATVTQIKQASNGDTTSSTN